MVTNAILDDLVSSGQLTSYSIHDVGEDGTLFPSKFRNTQMVVLNFPNGKTVVMRTWCSGSAEDTGIDFSRG